MKTELGPTPKSEGTSQLFSMIYCDFSDLIVREQSKKKRRCLKCRESFISNHYGKRLCGSCAAQNRRASTRAEHGFSFMYE